MAEVLSQSLKIKKTPNNSKEEPELPSTLRPTTLNS